MTAAIDAGLARLGVRRLLLAIHDASFPTDPDEDLGRGTPASAAAERLFAHVRDLGFTGIQLGPQGQTSRGNPSPYDGEIFTRHTGNIAARTWRALAGDAAVERWLVGGGPARHAHAFDAAADLAARAGADAQELAHDEHQRVRARAGALGLALYGDLQVGYAVEDVARHRGAFLTDLTMGAPPSRTNPDGQPWGYPVLDPEQYAGAAGALVRARADRAFADYDGVRIDHPHGLVCPWVYAHDVQAGTRLFESPDRLPRYAIARLDQLDPGQPRYADGWVTDLDEAQVDRYAALVAILVDSAVRHRRDPRDLSCEVLSTMPLPLARVLRRFGLGRWRVTQKADLADPRDVYRLENAAPEDWVMIGNHDTAPIFALLRDPARRDAWARHLAARLALRQPERLADPHFLATAMLAELFASRAENVMIFFADLFGLEERFNTPGVISDANWTLRLPPDYARLRGLDIPLAIELALQVHGAEGR